MSPCLNERALLRMYTHESTVAERSHLRLCADCAERYDLFTEELEVIGHVLQAPPPRAVQPDRVWSIRMHWVPMAAGCITLLALMLGVGWRGRPSATQSAASTSTVSAFAADLSAALFAPSDPDGGGQLASEAPYLEAALDAGQLCTQERFFTGECNDQVSAFVIEASDEEAIR
jgi:hypothetical protein